MALKLQCIITALILFFLYSPRTEAAIGINWGRSNYQQLLPSMVVDILLQNNISEVRVYDPEIEVLDAFINTKIGLTICIVENSLVNTSDKALQWIQQYIVPYTDKIKFSHIYVGNQPFNAGILANDASLFKAAVDSVMIMQSALNDVGLGQKIKATAGHTEGVLKLPIPRRSPSESEFSDLARDEMSRLVRFLRDNESPFVVEMMTIAFLINNSLPLTFGYGSTGPRVTDHGNRFVYENIFHFSYDSYIHALNKINASDIRVVVGMVGWPTDGSWGANVATAESFFRYLLPAVAGTRGSPARPNKSIDVYVHALTDENKNPSYFPFSRHWGIYRTNGEPKYKIDLSGQGRDVYPTTARGISRMPPRWCVLDEKAEKYSEDAVWVLMNQACEKIDCTSLVDGGSCGNMTFAKNASYAFNMFFQTNFQDEKACEFEGLGKVVNQNPSEGTCVFAVEVTLDRGAIKTTPTTISSTTRPSYTQQHLLFIFASLILLVI